MTIEDGLPSNSITAFYHDSRHIFWIGTRNGLCSFDGKDMTIYNDEPDSKYFLPGDAVQDIYEDLETNIWIINHIGGIRKFDRNKPLDGFVPVIGNQHFPKLIGTGARALFLYADKNEVIVLHDDVVRSYQIRNQTSRKFYPLKNHPIFGCDSFNYYRPIRSNPSLAAVFKKNKGLAIFDIRSNQIHYETDQELVNVIAKTPGKIRFNIIDPFAIIFSELGKYWIINWRNCSVVSAGTIPSSKSNTILTGGPLADGSFMFTTNRKNLYRYYPNSKQLSDESRFLYFKDSLYSTFGGFIETRFNLALISTNLGLIFYPLYPYFFDNYKIPNILTLDNNLQTIRSIICNTPLN